MAENNVLQASEVLHLMPPWVVVIAIVSSLVLTIIHIVKAANLFSKLAYLEIRLTREVFFRITSLGEVLFSNAILLARKGSIEIKNIWYELHKQSAKSEKGFKLNILKYGEKVRAAIPSAEHYFHTSSPIDFILENKPRRTLCMSAVDEYSSVIAKHFDDFALEIDRLRQYVMDGNVDDQDMLKQYIYTKSSEITNKHSSNILDAIQLEDGNYILTIYVSYRRVGFFKFLGNKQTSSSIKFKIEGNLRDRYKGMIQRQLYIMANNILFNQSTDIPFPEYGPLDVEEL